MLRPVRVQVGRDHGGNGRGFFVPAIEFFREISIVDFPTGTNWAPLFEPPAFGVLLLIAGTLLVTGCACLVCIPFGLGSAIYLSEYAWPRTRKYLKPALGVLAGIPTVVYGYFALTFMTPLLQDIGVGSASSAPSAQAFVMGVMLLPTVASVSEDSMSAVPQDLRDVARPRIHQASAGFDPDRRPAG